MRMERRVCSHRALYPRIPHYLRIVLTGFSAIESRVARIKARVAELTGNMEGVQGPGARPAVPR